MQKINKILATLLVLVLMIGMFPVSAAAAGEEPTITVSNVDAMAGDEVDVTVSLNNNPGLTVLRLFVEYDDEMLDLIGITDSKLLEGYQGNPEEEEFAANPAILYWANDLVKEDNSANGVLATLTFKVRSEAKAGEKATVSVKVQDAYNWEMNDRVFATKDGTVAVTAQDVSTFEVTFRLIGDSEHGKDGGHTEFVTWIPTTTYQVHEGMTVSDVFNMALEDYGMEAQWESEDYVAGIYAPAEMGGYLLSQRDNGPNSGWVYTVDGKRTNDTLAEYILAPNEAIVWHYIDDYTTENHLWESCQLTKDAAGKYSVKMLAIPQSAYMFAAGYTNDGKMTESKIIDLSQMAKTAEGDMQAMFTIAGDRVKVFVLNKTTYAPIRNCMEYPLPQ